jgi:hypothetical protein
MRVLKAAVLGLALAGFSVTAASACGMGKKSAQTIKPDSKQTVVTNDSKK